MINKAAPSALWNGLLSGDERKRIDQAKFARRSGMGTHPAVLVIDVQNYMLGPIADEPYDYPSSCGTVGREATGKIARLLDSARNVQVPVIYTRFELARDGSDMGTYGLKRDMVNSEGWCLEGSFGSAVAEQVSPQSGDIVIVKKKPSAFVGTPLLGLLIDRQIDTVIIVGGSTSNCVRATAVDAAALNLRVVVPADCVFDRFDVSHRVSLFDLDRQYADVNWCDDVVAELEKGHFLK